MINRFLRVRRRVLQAPVIRYVHPRSGQVVTLVAVAHIADRRYYHVILRLITRLEGAGAVVQFEMIRPAPEEDWAAASDSERAALEACRRSGQFRVSTAAYLGWVSQDVLLAAPGWQNADMTDLEYIRAVGPKVFLDDDRDAAEILGLLGSHAGLVFGAASAVLWRLLAADRWQIVTRLVQRGMDPVLERVTVAERSARAVSHLPAGRDAVMVWGAGHLDTIDGGLRRLGYTRAAVRWVALGRLPAARGAVLDLCRALAAAVQEAR